MAAATQFRTISSAISLVTCPSIFNNYLCHGLEVFLEPVYIMNGYFSQYLASISEATPFVVREALFELDSRQIVTDVSNRVGDYRDLGIVCTAVTRRGIELVSSKTECYL